MEESPQIAIPSTFTEIVTGSMEEPMQIAITYTDTDIAPGSMEEPWQIAIINMEAIIVSMLIEKSRKYATTPAGDQPNNLFAEAEKALQSDGG